jgi:hypothetical protein
MIARRRREWWQPGLLKLEAETEERISK